MFFLMYEYFDNSCCCLPNNVPSLIIKALFCAIIHTIMDSEGKTICLAICMRSVLSSRSGRLKKEGFHDIMTSKETILTETVHSTEKQVTVMSSKKTADIHKDGYSRETLTGYINHYDSKGQQTGYSRPGLAENTWVHYDEDGNRIGVTRDNLVGGTTTTDAHGRTIGTSRKNLVGGTNYYDEHGKLVGRSRDNLFGGTTDSEGFANQTSTGAAGPFTRQSKERQESSSASKIAYIIMFVLFLIAAIIIGTSIVK